MEEKARPRQPYPYENAPRLPATGPISLASLTASQAPLELEIGPGRGTFIMERAVERPDLRIVALEIRWKWATLVDQRLAKMGLSDRARVYAEDARLVLPRMSPDAAVEAVYIHFPDPWWKKRQAKRLVVAPSFITDVIRLLRPGGMLFVQTDVEDRAEGYETLLNAQHGLLRDGDEEGSARIAACPWTAQSNREKRAHVDQIPVNRLRYRKA